MLAWGSKIPCCFMQQVWAFYLPPLGIYLKLSGSTWDISTLILGPLWDPCSFSVNSCFSLALWNCLVALLLTDLDPTLVYPFPSSPSSLPHEAIQQAVSFHLHTCTLTLAFLLAMEESCQGTLQWGPEKTFDRNTLMIQKCGFLPYVFSCNHNKRLQTKQFLKTRNPWRTESPRSSKKPRPRYEFVMRALLCFLPEPTMLSSVKVEGPHRLAVHLRTNHIHEWGALIPYSPKPPPPHTLMLLPWELHLGGDINI